MGASSFGDRDGEDGPPGPPGTAGATGLGGGVIEMIIDGGGVTITTGYKGYRYIPNKITIISAVLLGDQSGSIVVDIFKCTYALFDASSTHPVSGDKITGSSPPTITTSTKSKDTTLSGWTPLVSNDSVLAIFVTSVTALTRCTLALTFTRP
jgi:hypothetical protein